MFYGWWEVIATIVIAFLIILIAIGFLYVMFWLLFTGHPVVAVILLAVAGAVYVILKERSSYY